MTIKQKKRNETDKTFQWRLDHLFANDALWTEEYDRLSGELEGISEYRGTLSRSCDSLSRCLKEHDRLCMAVEKVYVYAHMKNHEDSNDPQYQALQDKADSLLIKLSAAISFINPEILGIDEPRLAAFMEESPELALYRHTLEDLLRQKEHILSAEMEETLAQAQEVGQSPRNIFSMLNNADLKFGAIANEDGQDQELTHGNFISFMESKNREVRKSAFETYYQAYWKQKNTLAAIYSASVKKDVFFSGQRRFAGSLDASLSEYNIPREVYTNLIAAVNRRLPLMHRYVELRKKKLGLDQLHMYDLYTPLVPEIDTAISYDKARETVLQALKPLGTAYGETLESCFQNGWIDVYENEGKKSGAYSWGAYGCHPYVLLNFDNKINDMFTLAHELGHAMHSHYSWQTQPYPYSDYTIFVAEVASTVNEALLMDYLLKTTEERSMRAYLLNYYMEQFRGTLFRQTMFAEFELSTHEMAERGEPLTCESLCKLYEELNRKYYGDGIWLDEQIQLEWSRIPHFYTPFYVYQYATGYSAAIALSAGILNKGESAVEAYLEFLKSGSKDYSIELLKNAGVDLSRRSPVERALDVFEGLLGMEDSI